MKHKFKHNMDKSVGSLNVMSWNRTNKVSCILTAFTIAIFLWTEQLGVCLPCPRQWKAHCAAVLGPQLWRSERLVFRPARPALSPCDGPDELGSPWEHSHSWPLQPSQLTHHRSVRAVIIPHWSLRVLIICHQSLRAVIICHQSLRVVIIHHRSLRAVTAHHQSASTLQVLLSTLPPNSAAAGYDTEGALQLIPHIRLPNPSL